MTSIQQFKAFFNKYINISTENNQDKLKIIGAGVVILATFFSFRYFYHKRTPSILRIQQIRQWISQGLEKAELSREQLVLQQQHMMQAEDLTMKFILVSKLKQKQRDKLQFVRNPFFPPFQQGLFIKQLGCFHRLLFNKFNLYKQHLLVVTKEFQPQSSLLNKQDFKQTILATKAVRGLYFYNSGPKAGASQNHKHIQVFPNQARDLPIFRGILQYCRQLKHQIEQKMDNDNPQQPAILQYPHFNFKHGLILIGNPLQNQSQMQKMSKNNRLKEDNSLKLKQTTFKAYEKLYLNLIGKFDDAPQDKADYNLIGCQHFLLIVPRKKQKAFNDLSVNAVGFMGSLMFKEKNLLNKYVLEKRLGQNILEDVTFSKKYKGISK